MMHLSTGRGRTQHFRLSPSLAENYSGFCFVGMPFYGHWNRPESHGRIGSLPAMHDSCHFHEVAIGLRCASLESFTT